MDLVLDVVGGVVQRESAGTNIGVSAPLEDAVATLTSTERRNGKTIITMG